MTVESSWLLLSLCVLCYALAGRLPAAQWVSYCAWALWLFTIVLVLCLVIRRLTGH